MKIFSAMACALLLAAPAFAAGMHAKGPKPIAISQGGEVALADFLVPGKYTIFEFTSEYCPPCRAYAEPLFALHQQRGDVAVVKVDINRSEVHQIDWDSPVAKQYELRSIPHFRVYGPNGALIATDQNDARGGRGLVDKWIMALPQS